MYLISSTNKVLPNNLQITYLKLYQHLDLTHVIVYREKDDYDFQIQTETQIYYNDDKSSPNRALIIPTQIIGKWPTKNITDPKFKIDQNWRATFLDSTNKEPSNDNITLLLADQPFLSRTIIFDTSTFTQDLTVMETRKQDSIFRVWIFGHIILQQTWRIYNRNFRAGITGNKTNRKRISGHRVHNFTLSGIASNKLGRKTRNSTVDFTQYVYGTRIRKFENCTLIGYVSYDEF